MRYHPQRLDHRISELICPDGPSLGCATPGPLTIHFDLRLAGIETKTKGVYSREELGSLAQTNVESLKEFSFFTFAKADGKKEKFQEPVDYFLEYRDDALTPDATLLKTPVNPNYLR